MKIQLQFLTDWRFLIPTIIGTVSLGWSMFNFFVGKLIASKITNNDLKHLTENVTKLEDENKIIKVDLKKDLNRIFNRLGKIDKAIGIRDALCNERHPKK